MDLQALYDLKERLEHAAIAGTGLLPEDFRLKRAVEAFAPLAAASPVFAKIASAAESLLSTPPESRGTRLLDVLALVDAVAYTQGTVNVPGELTPIEGGNGTYVRASYGQLRPLLTALTTTGGGRMEVVQSAWGNHPEFFRDFRVLPALIADLGDNYGELAELNAKILKQGGPAVPPLLKKGFDPAGKKEMARRVEIISAIEGAGATPWLLEILPEAKKDVRAAVLTALGGDPDNTALLLDLSKTERGNSRDAVLAALAKQDGEAARTFWTEEVKKKPDSVKFLRDTNTEWAAALVASGLREQLERMRAGGGRVSSEAQSQFSLWCGVVGKKTSAPMLDFWRWAGGHMETFDGFTNEKGNPIFAGVRLTDTLRECLRLTGPGSLCGFCLTLFDSHPAMTRYLIPSFHAALLTRPAAEVYEKYAPYILTKKPLLDANRKKTCNNVLLRALEEVLRDPDRGCYVLTGGQPLAEPLDKRWIARLVLAVEKPDSGTYYPFGGGDKVTGFDRALANLSDPADPEQCGWLAPYFRKRMVETGSWYSYGRYVLQFGGSPKGVLGEAMKKCKYAYLYNVWLLLNEAGKSLPAGEIADLCQEALDTERFLSTSRELFLAKKVIPWTIEQLRAGKPFPAWDEWHKFDK